MPVRRSGDVLPMTLTEILVLLFFILALAFAWRAHRYRHVPSEGLDDWNSWVLSGGSLPDDWKQVLACVEKSVPRDDGRTCSEVLEAARGSIGEVAASLGLDTGALPTDVMLDSIADQIRLALAIAKDAIQDFGLDSGMVGSLALPDLLNVLRGQGSHPPCWWQFVAGDREILFVLEVVLRTHDISISPIWPDVYDDEANRVTNLVELSRAGRISYDEFRTMALPVFLWGQQQNPQCRHFVIIHDSVRGGDDEKEDFKEALLTVESYFYKHLVN